LANSGSLDATDARFVPHFYVVAADGTCWHFKTVKDVLPFPLCLLWFEGRFQEF
jgi:hypothetical protein